MKCGAWNFALLMLTIFLIIPLAGVGLLAAWPQRSPFGGDR